MTAGMPLGEPRPFPVHPPGAHLASSTPVLCASFWLARARACPTSCDNGICLRLEYAAARSVWLPAGLGLVAGSRRRRLYTSHPVTPRPPVLAPPYDAVRGGRPPDGRLATLIVPAPSTGRQRSCSPGGGPTMHLRATSPLCDGLSRGLCAAYGTSDTGPVPMRCRSRPGPPARIRRCSCLPALAASAVGNDRVGRFGT